MTKLTNCEECPCRNKAPEVDNECNLGFTIKLGMFAVATRELRPDNALQARGLHFLLYYSENCGLEQVVYRGAESDEKIILTPTQDLYRP